MGSDQKFIQYYLASDQIGSDQIGPDRLSEVMCCQIIIIREILNAVLRYMICQDDFSSEYSILSDN